MQAAQASVPVTLGLRHRRECVQRTGRSAEAEVGEGSRLRGIQAQLCHEITLRPRHQTSYIFNLLICDKRQKNTSSGFPGGSVVKKPPASVGDRGLIQKDPTGRGATKPMCRDY